ncbi:MAG: hypothetical protein XD50_1369 [Clostridia bacterium 41_269]|nr:MAG: hypothetical protein XD50_1369 [Clostridia bacterium 41_269]
MPFFNNNGNVMRLRKQSGRVILWNYAKQNTLRTVSGVRKLYYFTVTSGEPVKKIFMEGRLLNALNAANFWDGLKLHQVILFCFLNFSM